MYKKSFMYHINVPDRINGLHDCTEQLYEPDASSCERRVPGCLRRCRSVSRFKSTQCCQLVVIDD